MEGADWLKIHSDNVLLSSLDEIKKCNLHKELKIQIFEDKVNDAGGLLREWTHMIMKEILDYNIGIFVIADTDDVTYKINSEAEIDDHIIACYRMLGKVYFNSQVADQREHPPHPKPSYLKVIGKSIFEKIMINAYFDRTLINFILGKKITLSDIFFYDKHLYKSWSYLLST